MTTDDALLVVASQAGIRLPKYSIDAEQLARVADHLAALGNPSSAGVPGPLSTAPATSTGRASPPDTRAGRFAARVFHPIVVSRSRRSFTSGEYQDAVLKAFRSVNYRTTVLASTSLDGAALMGKAFATQAPLLTLSDRTTESEENEHEGTRFMMMGAMRAMRNPRAHEEEWNRDFDEAYVLDALSFASLLHRLLDIAESRMQA